MDERVPRRAVRRARRVFELMTAPANTALHRYVFFFFFWMNLYFFFLEKRCIRQQKIVTMLPNSST